jgi:hypothetical protein
MYGFVQLVKGSSSTTERFILFTSQASFTWDGISSSQNLHTWSYGNPHQKRVTNFQRRFSVNGLCALLDNSLFEPFVFDNNLPGYTYKFFLRMCYQDC